MRKHIRIGIAALAAASVVIGASSAWAGTITMPSSNPFSVPGDATGTPQSFTVVASGYPAGNSIVSIEQCDGVPSSDPGYSPLDHCDDATSPAAVDVGANGIATFPANNANFGFFPFKGPSPKNKFNCIAPGEPNPGNGKATFTNCQIRVATDNLNVVGDQSFLTLTLPVAAAPNPSCTMGAGIPQTPPKPPKNSGLDKLSKGLLTAPQALKDTKHKLTGTLENCANFPTAVKTGTPITSGSVKVQAELAPGSTCANIVSGAIVKSKVQVKWNAIDPKSGKPKTVATDKAMLSSFVRTGAGIPVVIDATSTPFDAIKSVFFKGRTVSVHFVMDETQAALDTACNDVKGKGIFTLHFTGLLGASTITVNP
jgi:hypothetical protein